MEIAGAGVDVSARLRESLAAEHRGRRGLPGIVAGIADLAIAVCYRSTSMDQIAADAAVSKQTVYQQFENKEQEVRSAADLRTVLTDLARRLIDGVLRPDVLALRRLVIAEAERFPDLAGAYFEQAPARGIDLIADALHAYQERGLLAMEDVHLAAAHLAYLVLGIPQDRAHFCPDDRPSPAERDRLATEAVRVFLAAYQDSRHWERA